jgi:hypothetical protein
MTTTEQDTGEGAANRILVCGQACSELSRGDGELRVSDGKEAS